MKIIKLLLPKALFVNRFGMTTGLPESALAVLCGLGTQGFQEAFRAMLNAMVTQGSAGEFAKIGEGSRQALGIEVGIKGDHMHVSRHDDKGIDAKMFLAMTKRETVGNDPASGIGDEHGQPFDYRVRQEVHGCFTLDAKAFHGRNCRVLIDEE
jgi:hypothetical protein